MLSLQVFYGFIAEQSLLFVMLYGRNSVLMKYILLSNVVEWDSCIWLRQSVSIELWSCIVSAIVIFRQSNDSCISLISFLDCLSTCRLSKFVCSLFVTFSFELSSIDLLIIIFEPGTASSVFC